MGSVDSTQCGTLRCREREPSTPSMAAPWLSDHRRQLVLGGPALEPGIRIGKEPALCSRLPRHLASVATLIPSSLANWPKGMLCGGSIFARTAAFRSGEYANSLSCPARLTKTLSVSERATTSLTGGPGAMCKRASFTMGHPFWGLAVISLRGPPSRRRTVADHLRPARGWPDGNRHQWHQPGSCH